MTTKLVLQRAEKSAELAKEYAAKIREQKKRAEQRKKEKAKRLATLKQEVLRQKKALVRKQHLQKLRHLEILDMLLAAACDGRSSEDISNLSVEDVGFLKSINANIKLIFKRQMSNLEYKKSLKTLQTELRQIDSEISSLRQSGVTLENVGRYTLQVWLSRHPGIPNPYANYPPEEAWWRCHNALQSNSPPAGVTTTLLNLLYREMNSGDDYSFQINKLKTLQKKRDTLSLSIKRLSSDLYLKFTDDINSVHTIVFSSLINPEKNAKFGVYNPIWIPWISKDYGGQPFIRVLTEKITAEVKKGRQVLSLSIFHPERRNRKKYETILYRAGRSRQKTDGPPLDIVQRVCRLYGYELSMDENTPDSIQISW